MNWHKVCDYSVLAGDETGLKEKVWWLTDSYSLLDLRRFIFLSFISGRNKNTWCWKGTSRLAVEHCLL